MPSIVLDTYTHMIGRILGREHLSSVCLSKYFVK